MEFGGDELPSARKRLGRRFDVDLEFKFTIILSRVSGKLVEALFWQDSSTKSKTVGDCDFFASLEQCRFSIGNDARNV